MAAGMLCEVTAVRLTESTTPRPFRTLETAAEPSGVPSSASDSTQLAPSTSGNLRGSSTSIAPSEASSCIVVKSSVKTASEPASVRENDDATPENRPGMTSTEVQFDQGPAPARLCARARRL